MAWNENPATSLIYDLIPFFLRKIVRLSLLVSLSLSVPFVIPISARAQVILKGTVYDITQKVPLTAVSVIAKSGAATITDTVGHYRLTVEDNDSVYFSYLGKRSPWFSVKSIIVPWNFDVALHVEAPELPPIFVTASSYREDSLQNRREFEKIFDYHRPTIATTSAPNGDGSAAVGFDLDAIINSFDFKYIKRQKGYQRFFEWEEHEKYIDHRFSKPLITKLTGFTGAKLDSFVKQYRPTYEFVEDITDVDLGLYIQRCREDFVSSHPSSAAAMMISFRKKGGTGSGGE